MHDQNHLTPSEWKKRLRVRAALLLAQITLPFGLYFALGRPGSLATPLIAAAFFTSMLFLVWLG